MFWATEVTDSYRFAPDVEALQEEAQAILDRASEKDDESILQEIYAMNSRNGIIIKQELVGVGPAVVRVKKNPAPA